LTVIILENERPSVRGQLTRWMLEIRPGVFVGTLSARVRDKLWVLAKARNARGGCILIARARNEQGFDIETYGDTGRQVFDNEGLVLISKPNARKSARSDP